MKGRTILLVGDDFFFQGLIRDFLEMEGAVVSTATSWGEALVLLPQVRPDVILSDIKLANNETYSFLKQWRQWELAHTWKPIPAIAASSWNRFRQEPLALTAGFQVYLEKPFDFAQLKAAIEQVLSDQK